MQRKQISYAPAMPFDPEVSHARRPWNKRAILRLEHAETRWAIIRAIFTHEENASDHGNRSLQ
eukprot:6304011-Pyramimonas_sp.AAC.1